MLHTRHAAKRRATVALFKHHFTHAAAVDGSKAGEKEKEETVRTARTDDERVLKLPRTVHDAGIVDGVAFGWPLEWQRCGASCPLGNQSPLLPYRDNVSTQRMNARPPAHPPAACPPVSSSAALFTPAHPLSLARVSAAAAGPWPV